MGTMALGGIFLNTAKPPSVGAVLDLIFDVSTGTHVRARAMVRTSMPGQGMGVKFVHMRGEDRSRLNQFLKSQIEAGNIEEDLRNEYGQVRTPPREMSREAAPVVCVVSTSWEMVFVPRENRASPIVAASPFVAPQAKEGQEKFDRQERAQARGRAREAQPAVDEKIAFEEELQRYAVILEKRTYYSLLGISGDCDRDGIKQSFYALAVNGRDYGSLQRAEPGRKARQLRPEARSVTYADGRRRKYRSLFSFSHKLPGEM